MFKFIDKNLFYEGFLFYIETIPEISFPAYNDIYSFNITWRSKMKKREDEDCINTWSHWEHHIKVTHVGDINKILNMDWDEFARKVKSFIDNEQLHELLISQWVKDVFGATCNVEYKGEDKVDFIDDMSCWYWR